MARDAIRRSLAHAWALWQKFWFAEIDLLPLCVFRAALALCLLFFVASRTGDLEMFYTDRGFIPSSYASSMTYLSYQKSIFHYYDSLAFVTACHWALLASLTALMLGFFTRIASVLSYVLCLMFVNRNPAIQYGVDFISMFFLFYLMFCNAGARFSVDAWRKGRKGAAQLSPSVSDLMTSVGFRLMQLQLCIIYFYSGTAKLKGTRWWNGSAIWDVFTMEGLVRFDMSFLAYFPHLLVAFCYITLIWEIYFPVLIWQRAFRNPLIIIGVIMHLGFGYFIQIPIFGALMCVCYIIFMDPAQLRNLLEKGFGLVWKSLARPRAGASA